MKLGGEVGLGQEKVWNKVHGIGAIRLGYRSLNTFRLPDALRDVRS